MQSVREIAMGKWPGILMAIGIDQKYLTGRHTACPICQTGRDRFRLDDKNGRGTFYCSHCGAGDGVELVMRVMGYDFKTAAMEIEKAAGFVKPEALKPGVSDEDKVKALRRLWKESRPVETGDEVWRYLTARKLPIPSGALRFHPSLSYRDGDETGRYPAMLALVTAPDGSGATIHRTYLTDGGKASVSKPKKLMPGLPISGASVRLFPAGPCLGIAEGIETALAASYRFQMPVWAAVSASGMESWVAPSGVTKVVVFGDNDANLTGQKAAYALANRLSLAGVEAEVRIPEVVGKDWADV